MSRGAFTLVELLVSIAIVALLLSVLLPALADARGTAHATVCAVGASHLQIANEMHAGDHDAKYAPGAPRFVENLTRWHGTRTSGSQAFRSEGGPLSPYYEDAGGEARRCPTFEPDEQAPGFERASGGYGYNNAFVGTLRKREVVGGEETWVVADDMTGSPAYRFGMPSETLAFGDAAFPDRRARELVIEYGFLEPRFNPASPSFRLDPSMHFRHRGTLANGVRLDGSARGAVLTHTWSSGFYTPAAGEVSIGWSGRADDNSLYDYE